MVTGIYNKRHTEEGMWRGTEMRIPGYTLFERRRIL
jgi:hypothetical protein